MMRVEVEMYTGYLGAGNVIGNVLFAHVSSPISNGYYNTSPRGDGITAIVSGIGWNPGECGPDDWGTTCYVGIHVHMEAKWHYSYNSSLENCANYPLATYGGTWIYEYFTP